MRRRCRPVAVLTVAVVMAGCGLRVEPKEQALNVGPAGSTHVTGDAGAEATQTEAGPAPGEGAPAADSASGSGTGAALGTMPVGSAGTPRRPGGSAGTGSASVAPQAGTTGGGTSADPRSGSKGSTAASAGSAGQQPPTVGAPTGEIKIGTIQAISGPLPGQFDGVWKGMQAYFDGVNKRGGINGRRVKLVVRDDGLDATKHQQAARALVEQDKVFALAGNSSAVQEAAADYLMQQGVPVVANMGLLEFASWTHPNFYPLLGSHPRRGTSYPDTYGKYLKAKGAKRFAAFWINVDVSRLWTAGQRAAIKSYGIDEVYSSEQTPAQPDYTGEVLRMRQADVDTVITGMDRNSNIRLVRAMLQQNFKPTIVLSHANNDTDTISQIGPGGDGILVESLVAPFSDKTPQMQEFLKTFKSLFPDDLLTSWGLYGWLSARLFSEALQQAGPDPTRAAITRVLDSNFTSWDPDGLAPVQRLAPGTRPQPAFDCQIFLRIEKGQFVRDSGDGFFCSDHQIKF